MAFFYVYSWPNTIPSRIYAKMQNMSSNYLSWLKPILTLFILSYSTQDVKSWKQKFNNAEFGSHKAKAGNGPKDVMLIHWAGGLH